MMHIFPVIIDRFDGLISNIGFYGNETFLVIILDAHSVPGIYAFRSTQCVKCIQT